MNFFWVYYYSLVWVTQTVVVLDLDLLRFTNQAIKDPRFVESEISISSNYEIVMLLYSYLPNEDHMPIDDELLRSLRTGAFNKSTLNLKYRELEDEDAFLLADALKNNMHVKTIQLYDNNIGDRGTKALAAIPNLEELDLWSNNLTCLGARYLAESNLKKVNVSDNKIGDEGIKAFSENTHLLELKAKSCGISSLGASDLIANNTTLKKLDLSQNLICDKA